MERAYYRIPTAIEQVYVKPLGRFIPLLDIPMMSDEREKELGRQSAAKWKGAMA